MADVAGNPASDLDTSMKNTGETAAERIVEDAIDVVF